VTESIVPQEKKDLIANKDEVFQTFGPMLGEKKKKKSKESSKAGGKSEKEVTSPPGELAFE